MPALATASSLQTLTQAAEDFPPILTLNEAGQIARRSTRTLRRWIASKRLPVVSDLGGKFLLSKRQLLQVLANE